MRTFRYRSDEQANLVISNLVAEMQRLYAEVLYIAQEHDLHVQVQIDPPADINADTMTGSSWDSSSWNSSSLC